MTRFDTSAAPHIRDSGTTQQLMGQVLLALLPAAAVGVWQFGLRSALVLLVCTVTAMAAEAAFSRAFLRRATLTDGTAAVTGLLLGLTLPPSIPYPIAALGALFAVVAVKGLFGGLGQNIFNPALAARAFLLLFFPAAMTHYTDPAAQLPLTSAADVATAATPLHHMVLADLPPQTLIDVFLGRVGGSVGEVSAAALLLGGIYLLWRRVISYHIPVSYLATVFLLVSLLHLGDRPLLWAGYNLCSGGVLLGAFFMATDYVTSPVTRRGQLLYGIGCGALTVLFRRTGLFPGGVTYAILLMNGCTWTIDRLCQPRRFGAEKGAQP